MKEATTFYELPIVGGHPAIDFVNTTLASLQIDFLASYPLLVEWAFDRGLIDEAEQKTLAKLPLDSAEAAQAISASHELRKVIHEIVLALSNKRRPSAEAENKFHRFYAEAMHHCALQWQGKDGIFTLSIGADDPRIIPWRLTKLAGELFTQDHHGRLRHCARPGCEWVFLDTSKGGARRWCVATLCGNQSRLRAFRERQAALAPARLNLVASG